MATKTKWPPVILFCVKFGSAQVVPIQTRHVLACKYESRPNKDVSFVNFQVETINVNYGIEIKNKNKTLMNKYIIYDATKAGINHQKPCNIYKRQKRV